MSQAQERTEKATPKRMREARREGKLSRSQDISAWLGIGAATMILPMVLEKSKEGASSVIKELRLVVANPDPNRAFEILGEGLATVAWALVPLGAVGVIVAIAANAAQGGLYFATKRLKPSFKNFNIVQGAKRIVGGQAWWNGAKAFLKTAVVGLVLWLAIQSVAPLLMGAGSLSLAATLDAAGSGATALLRSAVVAGTVLAIFDVLVIAKRNRKQTRMSKQELKEEHKHTEGDPQIKGAIRSKQLAMSRNRMMAAIADADVVVVNPTHVAVALQYNPASGAPRVVAKGAGHVAARIRQRATELRVPMVADVPLARALHAACELDQEIPPELYTAVAQVLAFVMALKRRGASAGLHRRAETTVVPNMRKAVA